MSQEQIAKIWDMIRDIKFAMLTSDDDGHLRSRPMVATQKSFEGTLWFFTRKHAHKVDELRDDPRVNVSYSDGAAQNYVSLSGTTTLVTDQATLAQHWGEAMRAWFPKGVDDPEIALLKVDVQQAEYWDAPNSKMVHAYRLHQSAPDRRVAASWRECEGADVGRPGALPLDPAKGIALRTRRPGGPARRRAGFFLKLLCAVHDIPHGIVGCRVRAAPPAAHELGLASRQRERTLAAHGKRGTAGPSLTLGPADRGTPQPRIAQLPRDGSCQCEPPLPRAPANPMNMDDPSAQGSPHTPHTNGF